MPLASLLFNGKNPGKLRAVGDSTQIKQEGRAVPDPPVTRIVQVRFQLWLTPLATPPHLRCIECGK